MIEVKFGCESVEDIKRKAYEQGVNDAIDAALKINEPTNNGGYTMKEIDTMFPDRNGDGSILHRITNVYIPMTIVSIVQDYEKNKKTLRVGDVIKTDTHCCGIVTKIDNCCNKYDYCILWRDGSVGHHQYKYLIKDKTGENMTIPEFLEKYGRIGE